MRTTGRGIRFPAPGTPSAFQPEPPVSLRPPSTPPFDDASSSRELSASSRVLRPATCPSYLNMALRPTERPTSASLGVLVPHRGINQRRPPPGRDPDPTVMFRPRRFSRPRRFAPPPAFAGLFHPAATSRVCPSGVCPSPRSRTGFPPPVHALVTLNAPACGCPLQPVRPRLQGLAPRDECGAARGCLDPARSAPLMGFSSPGCSLRATWQPLQATSAHDLRCEEPSAVGPRRFAAARIGLPGIRLPTRSSFLA